MSIVVNRNDHKKGNSGPDLSGILAFADKSKEPFVDFNTNSVTNMARAHKPSLGDRFERKGVRGGWGHYEAYSLTDQSHIYLIDVLNNEIMKNFEPLGDLK